MNRCRRIICIWFVLMSIGVMEGCGDAPRTSPDSPSRISYLPNGVHILARGMVLPNLTFVILGEHYMFSGKTYFGLKAAVGLPGRAPAVGGENTGTSLRAGEQKPLIMIMQTGCLGSRSYALVAGVVRIPDVVVVAKVDHRTIQLQRAAIPGYLDAGGSLVYGVLPAIPSDVMVRGMTGRMLVNERYGGVSVERCPRGETSSSAVGSVG
jgi:hypothetical protein